METVARRQALARTRRLPLIDRWFPLLGRRLRRNLRFQPGTALSCLRLVHWADPEGRRRVEGGREVAGVGNVSEGRNPDFRVL
jgi:hypothetical protein